MSKIKEIRFCLSDANNKNFHKIFKLALSVNGDNFYLHSKNGDVKVSFHKTGTKYLRIKGLEDSILYKDLHYNQNNLNPVFAYLPKKINEYPLLKKSKPGTALIKVEKSSDDSDIAIILHRVNYQNDGVFINEKYKSILNWKIEGHDQDGNLIESNNPVCLLDFGEQKFCFEILKINRKGFDYQKEHVILFKPGIEIDFSKIFLSLKFPINENNKPSVSFNTKEEIYLISY